MNAGRASAMLEDMAQLMEILEENAFKVRALRNAARSLQELDEDFAQVAREGRLQSLPGVGKSIAAQLETLVATGELPAYQALRESVPPGLHQMLRVPGLGPKRIRQVYMEAGIEDLDDLEQAAEDGRLAKLKGFGPKTAQRVLKGIAFARDSSELQLRSHALPGAERTVAQLAEVPGVKCITAVGELRRGMEVVDAINLLATAEPVAPLMQQFIGLPTVAQVVNEGERDSTVVLPARRGAITCRLRICDPRELATMLLHETGSDRHWAQLRQRAEDRGLLLTEQELKAANGDTPPACVSEAEVYAALGLVL